VRAEVLVARATLTTTEPNGDIDLDLGDVAMAKFDEGTAGQIDGKIQPPNREIAKSYVALMLAVEGRGPSPRKVRNVNPTNDPEIISMVLAANPATCAHPNLRGPKPGEEGGEYCDDCTERMKECSHSGLPAVTERMGKPIATCERCGIEPTGKQGSRGA